MCDFLKILPKYRQFNVVILITVDGKEPQCFETRAVPFLPELKMRRNQYDLL